MQHYVAIKRLLKFVLNNNGRKNLNKEDLKTFSITFIKQSIFVVSD